MENNEAVHELALKLVKLEAELEASKLTTERLEREIANLKSGIGRGLWILGGGFLTSLVAWVAGGGLVR